MRTTVALTFLLVLPAVAAAQGRSVSICGRDVDARATGDDQARIVFGATGAPGPQTPGTAVAAGEDFVVFGADPTVDQCPCGSTDVGGPRLVYRWQVRLETGGTTLVREDCLAAPPTDVASGTDLETLGPCLRCRWVRN